MRMPCSFRLQLVKEEGCDHEAVGDYNLFCRWTFVTSVNEFLNKVMGLETGVNQILNKINYCVAFWIWFEFQYNQLLTFFTVI